MTGDRMDLSNYIVWPLICSLMMVAWTAAVSHFTTYEDYRASYPIVGVFIAIVFLHLAIIIKKRDWTYVVYAALHVPLSFGLGIVCLMLITKDSI